MGDLDTKAGKSSQLLLDKTLEWSETFYDKGPEFIENIFSERGDECNRIVYIEYQYYEVGLTREWFNVMAAGIADNLTARRELLLQRLHGSSLSPYDQEDINTIIEMQKEPIDELWINDYYKFDVYTPLERRKVYLIGIDCSSGTNSDNDAVTVIDPYSLEPVAEFECPYIGETKYEQLLISLIRDHLPRSVLCIERNSMGDGIIDHLLHSPISQNIYYDKDRDLVGQTMHNNQTIESLLRKEASMKRYYGVYTEGKSREDMFAILSRHINEYKEKFVTKNITRDISSLIRTSSGKIVAAPGFHDDSIMSYLIAMYVRYHGNNLAVFGINLAAPDSELNNSGLKRPEEIDTTLVDKKLVDAAIRQEQLESQANAYEKIMQEAIYKSQADSYKLKQKGLIDNTIFDNTPDIVIESYDNDDDFNNVFNSFNALNGQAPNRYNSNDNTNNPVFGSLW